MISTILAWQPLVSMLPVATTTIARKGRRWAVLLVPMFAQVFAEAVAASLYGRLQWPEVRNNAPSLGGEKPSPLSDVFSGATGGGDA